MNIDITEMLQMYFYYFIIEQKAGEKKWILEF